LETGTLKLEENFTYLRDSQIMSSTALTHPIRRVEWPTLLLLPVVISSCVLAVITFRMVHPVIGVLGLGFSTGWWWSFQHELLHAHPFADRRIGDAIGWLPFNIWSPYGSYRDSHLVHHRNEILTDPNDDPESWYTSASSWDAMRPSLRSLLWANRTLAGRLLIGPALGISGYLRHEVRLLRGGDRREARYWLTHSLVVTAYFAVVVGLARVPWWAILVGNVQLGTALIYLRSFAEHRWAVEPGMRSAMVVGRTPFALLFLNNNLHLAHHERPGEAWFRLPRVSREIDAANVSANGAGLYRGYFAVARAYAFRPFCQPLHPSVGVLLRGSDRSVAQTTDAWVGGVGD
jgi:fatty acid desaturase